MHQHLRFLIIFLFWVGTGHALFAQKMQMEITVYAGNADDTGCYRLFVVQSGDTVYKNQFDVNVAESVPYIFSVDSLAPGTCRVTLESCQGHYYSGTTLAAKSGYKAYLNLTTPETVEYFKIDETTGKEVDNNSPENELTLGYVNNGWFEKSRGVNNAFSIALTPYFRQSVANHFGFMEGIGWGWSYYGLKLNNSPVVYSNSKQITEFYSYGFLTLNAKIRLSAGNQREKNSGGKLYLDVGGSYYIPLFFLDIGHYSGHKRSFEGRLHQFTDLRCFANLGWKHVYAFAEYRLFDFVLGNRQEVFRYNAGLRITGLFIN